MYSWVRATAADDMDTDFSGCTAVVILVRDSTAVVLNVGDSRAVAASHTIRGGLSVRHGGALLP